MQVLHCNALSAYAIMNIREYLEVRETNANAILIEIAFHDNADDARWIINNTSAITTVVGDSIIEYIEKKF